MNQFKPGDRVEYTGLSKELNEQFRIGDKGTVIEYDSSRNVRVCWDNADRNTGIGNWAGHFPENLKLISASTEDKMDIQAAYLLMQEKCGIKEGDTVKVIRVAKKHEMGWQNCWVTIMNDYLGKEFVVRGINKNGIYLNSYGFPFFVLEKVKDAKPPFTPITIRLNASHTATVSEKFVDVGCQRFSFDKIKELNEAVKKAEEYNKQ
jgi:hypothetical protein